MPSNDRRTIRREIIKQMILAECVCQDGEEMWSSGGGGKGKVFHHNGPEAESDMIRSNLATLAKKAYEMHDSIGHHDDLPEWVQEKIAVADSMIGSVYDYLDYEYSKHNEPDMPEHAPHDDEYEYKITDEDDNVLYHDSFSDDEHDDHFDMIQEVIDDEMVEPEEEDAIRVEPWHPLRQSTGIMFFEDED
jgi:hypothetical protein